MSLRDIGNIENLGRIRIRNKRNENDNGGDGNRDQVPDEEKRKSSVT